jgi:DNA polymerase type B, organellar and viral
MHAIKRNHSREHPRNLVFTDTEAIGRNPADGERETRLLFRLSVSQRVRHNGSDYTPDEMVAHYRPKDWWDWLLAGCTDKTVTWVFAHNMWFDLTMLGIQGMMDYGRIKLTNKHKVCKACTEGSCLRCKCWRGCISLDPGASFATLLVDKKRINFVDSFNFYRTSLVDIGNSHGMTKGIMPTELDGADEWLMYCRQDVNILKVAMCELIRNWYVNDLGNFQLTAPGLAFSCYRHRFMSQSIVPHQNKDVQNDEIAAYFGGETTVFFRGRITQTKENLYDEGGERTRNGEPELCGPVYHVDCNSLYPYVMHEQMYPAMYLGSLNHPAVSEIEDRLWDYSVVASVEIDSQSRTFPFRCGGRIWYPNGRFPTTLCTPELHAAIAGGMVSRIYCCHLYESKPLFNEWVKFWYSTKQLKLSAGDGAGYEFAKLMLNSLSGKFAQKLKTWRIDSRSMPLVEWGRWPRYLASKRQWQICRALGKLVQVQECSRYAEHALVAISAHITSAGRQYMASVRETANECFVLYQDTDSLFLTETGYRNLEKAGLIHDDELGKFKLQEVIIEGGIYGRQDYEADGRVVKAGLPRDAVKVGKRKWRFNKLESPESMMARMPDGTIVVKECTMSGSELCIGRQYGVNGRSTARNAVSIMRECGIIRREWEQ